MRIVIVGQGWMGAEVLKLCLKRGDEVIKTLAPGAGDNGEYDRLAAAAMQAGIPVEVCGKRVEAAHIPTGIGLILAAHAHAYITRGAREAARLGALGYHPSLLPRHRGRDAVRWTIHMRDPIAGGTVYWLDDGADTGLIAAQDWCHILPDDDARALWRRDLAPMGLRLFEKVLADIDRGVIKARPQIDAVATWEPAFCPDPKWRAMRPEPLSALERPTQGNFCP